MIADSGFRPTAGTDTVRALCRRCGGKVRAEFSTNGDGLLILVVEPCTNCRLHCKSPEAGKAAREAGEIMSSPEAPAAPARGKRDKAARKDAAGNPIAIFVSDHYYRCVYIGCPKLLPYAGNGRPPLWCKKHGMMP
jgi:hypothetical protein